jgi:hypothetical protein
MKLREWSNNSAHRDDSDRDPTPLDPRIIPVVSLERWLQWLIIQEGVATVVGAFVLL